MSIATEIARLQQAKADLKASINAKGGTITDETIDEYAGFVDNLPSPKEEETKTVTPNFSSGNEVVTPTSGKVMTQVTINKDANLLAENIKSGVTIFGITGTYSGAPSSYTLTLTGDYAYGAWTSIVCLKINNPPISDQDYDAYKEGPWGWKDNVGNNIVVPFENVFKVYLWKNSDAPGTYKINDGSELSISDGYANAIEITLTENTTLWVKTLQLD